MFSAVPSLPALRRHSASWPRATSTLRRRSLPRWAAGWPPLRSLTAASATALRPAGPCCARGAALPRLSDSSSVSAASPVTALSWLEQSAQPPSGRSQRVRSARGRGRRRWLLAHARESQVALAGRRGSGRQQAHRRLPRSRQRRAAGVADHNAGSLTGQMRTYGVATRGRTL
jgi:hypothetical protein